MKLIRVIIAFVFVFQSAGLAIAQAPPPIEAYGELPSIRSLTISPDGAHLAFLITEGELEKLVIYTVGEGPLGTADTTNIKTRSAVFYDNDHVVLSASKTIDSWAVRGKYEHSAAFSFNFADNKFRQLLRREDDIYFAQTGLGKIIGTYGNGGTVLMPAYVGTPPNPTYNLLKTDLDSERADLFMRGTTKTIDWFVSSDGTHVVREDLDNREDRYTLLTKTSGRWQTIYTKEETSAVPFRVDGFNPANDAMIIIDSADGDFSAIHELAFDGSISEPIMTRAGKEISTVLTDRNRTVHGVRYAGLQPIYEMYDPSLTAILERLQARFPASSVIITSWTEDWSKIILRVSGGSTAGTYLILDTADETIEILGSARTNIPDTSIAAINKIEYQARDGLALNGILTMPLNPGAAEGNWPMIVLPHGGPASHNTITFHWMAQYFASRGYLVFQPNFRGSTGFGDAFQSAGDGEWGGKMQDDITDGVIGIIDAGLADPDRICIVGASYGGYAALAGGAFTPDLYKCVVSVAGVSDLPKMLIDERRENQPGHWVVEYWERVIGDPREQREKLRSISPAHNAEGFQAPVLLIHGKDDTVVRMNQSTRMRDALRRADKNVELIKLRGEDHWLSTSETRLATLEAIDAFVTQHLGTP